MTKRELAQCLARRYRQSQGMAADKVDALIYALWKTPKHSALVIPAQVNKEGNLAESSSAPVKKS